MAHSRQAKKRIKVNQTKALKNTMIKSALKTTIKKFEVAVEAGNKEEAATNFSSVVKALDMAATKNVIHKNKAARKKSRFAARLSSMN